MDEKNDLEARKNELNYAILKQIHTLKLSSDYGDLPLENAQIEKIQDFIEVLCRTEIRHIDHRLKELSSS